MRSKVELHHEAMQRMKALAFGEPVTNICAGDKSPQRLCYFVELVVKSHKNKFGIVHRDYWAKCTDRKGKFWNTSIDVVFPGHLDYATCNELFTPIHAVLFG